MVHYIKTHTKYFNKVESEDKGFELRLDDREYSVGDVLVLKDFNPVKQSMTDRQSFRLVTYILKDAEEFGLKRGFVIMSLRKLKRLPHNNIEEAIKEWKNGKRKIPCYLVSKETGMSIVETKRWMKENFS